jgi:hypothetical protein
MRVGTVAAPATGGAVKEASVFYPETLAANSRLRGHWNELWANRNIFAGGRRQYRSHHRNPAQLLAFFGPTGPFGLTARRNKVTAYDKLWVSPEVWANMAKPYLVDINTGTNGVERNRLEAISRSFLRSPSRCPTRCLAMSSSPMSVART